MERLKVLCTPPFSSRLERTRNLLWPCAAYTFLLPIRPVSPFNIFDRVILRLLLDSPKDSKKLSEIACLPPELVIAILSRLQQRGCIDKRNKIQDKSLEEILNEGSTAGAGTMYETVLLLVEHVENIRLPVVLRTSAIAYEAAVNEGGYKAFIESSKGGAKTKYDLVRSGSGATPLLGEADVPHIAALHARKYKKYAAMGMKNLPEPVRLTSLAGGGATSGDAKPELVYLKLAVGFSKANQQVLCLPDPFGFGFSDELTAVFRRYLDRTPVMASRIHALRGGATGEDAQDDTAAELLAAGFGLGLHSYPALRRVLSNALKYRKKIVIAPNAEASSASEKAMSQCAQQMYEALEVTLQLCDLRNYIPATYKRLSFCSEDSNWRSALDQARKIGQAPERSPALRGLLKKGSHPRNFQGDYVGSMEPLLVLCIAAAAERNDFPLHILLDLHPDWLHSWVPRLKRIRDAESHADASDLVATMRPEDIDALWSTMRECIGIFLPEIILTTFEGPVTQNGHNDSASTVEHILNSRGRARSALDALFGWDRVSNMDTSLRSLLLQVELETQAWRHYTEEELSALGNPGFIVALCKPQEECLRTLCRALPKEASSELWPDLVRSRAKEAGFVLYGDRLFKSLYTVRDAMQGAAGNDCDASFGAYTLCFFARAPMNVLQRIQQKNPALLRDIDELLQLRRHSGTALPIRKLLTLKSTAFTNLKLLLENVQ